LPWGIKELNHKEDNNGILEDSYSKSLEQMKDIGIWKILPNVQSSIVPFVTIIDILDCSEIPMEWAIPLKFWRKMNTISNLGFSFVCVYNSYVSILMFSSKQHFRNFTLDLVPI